jgi:putative tryptophan/tyrosine transport system substrate-binding protein
MRRREFITLLGGTFAAWPLPLSAQQGEPMRRVGVLMNLAENDPEGQARIGAFLQSMQQSGWTNGRNVQIDIRWGAGDPERVRKHAIELVGLPSDVILASTAVSVDALQLVTRTVPVVFVQVVDPVGGDYVESLSRPGRNATGFSNFEYGMSGKWLELLKEIVPRMTRVAVIRDPRDFSRACPVGCYSRCGPVIRC